MILLLSLLLFFFFLLRAITLFKKAYKDLSFQIGRDEVWRHTFKTAAMTSFHAEKCCHLLSTHVYAHATILS